MDDLIRAALLSQYEAALSMLRQTIEACPDDAWERKIANGTARWGAYHALVFTEVYLGQTVEAFEPHAFYVEGGPELSDEPGHGLSRVRTLEYLAHCLDAVRRALSEDSAASLAAADGFGRGITRAELHLYNIRHIQHHAAQLSAHVRRALPDLPLNAMPWIGSGWRD